ncbi:hypothetical protein P4114_12165 [Pseudomonas aeruginosa]|nr:hypothetical protein [Pseudomonas aeruginosa]
MRQLARRLAIELGFQASELERMTLGDLLWWRRRGRGVSDGAVRQASGARATSVGPRRRTSITDETNRHE